jgi:hypothetical protein
MGSSSPLLISPRPLKGWVSQEGTGRDPAQLKMDLRLVRSGQRCQVACCGCCSYAPVLCHVHGAGPQGPGWSTYCPGVSESPSCHLLPPPGLKL